MLKIFKKKTIILFIIIIIFGVLIILFPPSIRSKNFTNVKIPQQYSIINKSDFEKFINMNETDAENYIKSLKKYSNRDLINNVFSTINNSKFTETTIGTIPYDIKWGIIFYYDGINYDKYTDEQFVKLSEQGYISEVVISNDNILYILNGKDNRVYFTIKMPDISGYLNK